MEFCASHRAAYEKLGIGAPFEIPGGWAWCKIGEICSEFQYGTAKKSTQSGLVPVLRMGNLNNGEIDYTDLVYTSDQDDIEQYALHPGDLLFNRTNSSEKVGKVAIFRASKPCVFAGYLVRFRPIFCDSDYVNYLMNSRYQWGFCQSVKCDAVNQSNISASKFAQFLVPLPPLAEQKRIVTRIEELFRAADSLDAAVDGLEATSRCLDKKILDLAIRGKLVPQNPTDEPASELMKRIATTSHKSPCKNQETPIEPPFNIPESWVWTRLGTICDFYLGKTPPRANKLYWDPPAVPWVTISDMTQHGHIIQTREGVSSYAIANGTIGRISPAGTLLMSFKLTIGKVSILDCDATHNEAIISILPCCDPSNMMRDYLFETLPCLVGNAETSPAIMGDTLNKKTLGNLLIPLPPLAEQKRIVSKVEELKSLLQKLGAI